MLKIVANSAETESKGEKSQSLPTTFPFSIAPFGLYQQAMDYWVDTYQRHVLFIDTLRQRSNAHVIAERNPNASVLHFGHELILDGRKLKDPVNYQLFRILPPEGVTVDPTKRPFIIFDPRAGHGPGIGGMKQDSEVGSTLRAGHPCYFVGFSVEPVPGQTVEHVYEAEAVFVAKVIEMHPESDKPCLIGNCQAGWQIAMMGTIYPELVGVLILAGAPLSYWAGVHGKNPLRYKGGLSGGSWAAALASDLGNGRFDGAALVHNFEGMNPSNTHWKKAYNLYSKVDTEAQRFLDFERWWGNPVLLNDEEIQFIVDELFIGNRLSLAKLNTSDGLRIDIRNIKAPIVVFCSQADDITPPQQALDWILDLYRTDDEVVAAGQTIIYCLHQSIGHLGIFVSSSVASKEHDKFIQNIGLIEALPAGLYEAVFIDKTTDTPHPELASGNHVLRFEKRGLADIRALGCNNNDDDRRFATVSRVSEIGRELYETFVSPFVSTIVTEESAEIMRRMHPIRVRYNMFSDRNPLLASVASMAEWVRQNRAPVAKDNIFLKLQEAASHHIISTLDAYRDTRDTIEEKIFMSIYGSPLVQALVGMTTSQRYTKNTAQRDVDRERDIQRRLAGVAKLMEVGGLREATVRGLMYVLRGSEGIDERGYKAALKILSSHPALNVTPADYQHLIHEQSIFLAIDEKGALESIPMLLDSATQEEIDAAITAIKGILMVRGELPRGVTNRVNNLLTYFVALHSTLYRRADDITVFENLVDAEGAKTEDTKNKVTKMKDAKNKKGNDAVR